MDPTENLRNQLALASKIADIFGQQVMLRKDIQELENAADMLATFVLALHDWISKGGNLPEQWLNKCRL
ncbi:MAG: hypothetical protein Q8O94_03935 [bacterium]|nr:hypothetical protein [bacterium]